MADLFDHEQHYSDAVNVLKEARAHVPHSNAVLLGLGTDLVRAEQYKEGLEVLRELVQKAPATPDAYIAIADAARRTDDQRQPVVSSDTLPAQAVAVIARR